MKWLVTAFEPFAGASSNSSLIVLRELEKMDWGDTLRFHAPVPVTFAGAWENVRGVIESSDFKGVLAFGQAESRGHIGVERVALNWLDARTADNSGTVKRGEKVAAGPDVLWSEIPWDQMPDLPLVDRSYSAGTFVCNALMFQLLAWAQPRKIKAGFVHFPVLDSQSDAKFANSPRIRQRDAVETAAKLIRFAMERR